ncbi:trimethylguanosine synthase-like isoform X2 [Cloeon dipterum]|uniref:trimethylguanosine synthase-like isoform X2 n=1 Tax=Cloeon dipterum TaxID=197152 RepID=UPI00322005BB
MDVDGMNVAAEAVVEIVPGPAKEQRPPQKRRERVRNSIGVLVETLRIFEAVREAAEEEEQKEQSPKTSEDEAEVIEDKSDSTSPDRGTRKRKQRKKKKKNVPEEVDHPGLHKYWTRRYQLFSKFDEGIQLDQESWFSVTPEEIAKHVAERCRQCDVVVDAFCGAGGNTIQFALNCRRVIAVDIDPAKILLATNNARVYGVQDKIEFICADFMQVAATLKADAIFLSPPWGGPDYTQKQVFNLEDLSCVDAKEMFKVAKTVSENVIMYMPRNTNRKQLMSLAGVGNLVEIEQSVFRSKVVALTAYFGKLIDSNF